MIFTILTVNYNLDDFIKSIFSKDINYITFNTNFELIKKLFSLLLKNNIAIIHSHGFTAGSLSTLVNFFFRIPHLMTVHENFQKNQFTGHNGLAKKVILSFLFNKINIIHTVSNDSKSDLTTHFPQLLKSNIKCISHGIDSDKFYFAKKAQLNIIQSPHNTCFIGFFGRFMAPKGFRVLIDAIDIIKQDHSVTKQPLVLTFDWGGFVREDYSNIKSRGLDNYFQMLQFTEDMPSVIKSMDIVAMPSLSEASGLVGMEALVAGVPIIGTSCIGLREVAFWISSSHGST